MNKTTKTEWTIGSSSWLLLDTSEIEDDYPGRTKEVFFVTAATDDGIVYSHFTAFATQEAADTLADRVRAAIATWTGPLDNPHWRYFRTEYGSPAYVRNWRRLEAQAELAEREAELGPQAAYDSLPTVMQAALA